MKWFHNLKVSAKLLLGFSIVALIAGAIGTVGVVNISNIDANDTKLYEKMTAPLGDLVIISENFQRIRGNVRDLVLSHTENEFNDYEGRIKNRKEIVSEALARFEKTLLIKQGREAVKNFKIAKEDYFGYVDQIAALVRQGKNAEALVLQRGDAEVASKKAEKEIQTINDIKVRLAKETSDSNSITSNAARTFMVVLVVIGTVLAVGLGIFIAGIINKPLKALVKVAEKIADGDLDVSVEVNSKDELGVLTQAFDKAARKTNEVMTNINSSAEQVAAGSKQVSISSQALSQGSTEQAASLEEITSSITEVAAQTKQNAVNANQANELAMAAKDSAIQGNQQMKGMLKAMEEINDSSANISKIIKVIDEIAFQTNILALNAAVEAARAGQHGKGFAVVAEEVRNLAARSANAAKETTAMIEGSIKKVEAGTKIANETAEALNKIVESVSGATNLVAEIANASNQQASAIAQVNQGIEQVSQVTQSNTATAEESASASEELSSQAELLKNMAAQFKIRKNQVFGQINGVSSEIIRALEDLVTKKGTGTHSPRQAMSEVAATGIEPKVKIHLDDTEFGKY